MAREEVQGVEKKEICDMSEEEILRQQMEILAEKSKDAGWKELVGLTAAMFAIYDRLSRFNRFS